MLCRREAVAKAGASWSKIGMTQLVLGGFVLIVGFGLVLLTGSPMGMFAFAGTIVSLLLALWLPTASRSWA